MDALVTDVHLRNALAGIRGMGRAGIRVVAVGRSGGAAGRWSRHAAERGLAPDVLADAAGFAAGVVRIAREHGPAVLYPCQEESIEALLAAELPAGTVLPWPDPKALRAVRDKLALPQAAAAAGLTAPAELYRGRAAGIPDGLPIPFIVKPVDKGQALSHPHAVEGADALEELRRSLPADEPVIVQELARGPLTAVVVLVAADGRLVASFHQEAVRTWPPGAGPSTVAVSRPPDPELAERCAALLRGQGYSGLAELQFVGTPAGPALIDVNARFYGSMALALKSGVNFPALWHELAAGHEPRAVSGYREGVGYRWLEGEVLAAIHGEPGLLLQRAPAPRTGAVWAADDPLPGALMAGRVSSEWLARQLRKARGRS